MHMRTIAVLAAALLLAACAVAEPFKVGLSLPLSGSGAEWGMAARNGFELARRDHPGVLEKIDAIFDDHQYEAARAVVSYGKLRTQYHADVIFMWGSQPCMSSAPLAERHTQPLVCFSGDPKPQFSYVVSFNSPGSLYAEPLADFIRSRSVQRWGLLTTQVPFLLQMADDLKSFLGSSAAPVVSEAVLPDMDDFASLAARVKQRRVDALVLFLLPRQLPLFLKQAHIQGLKTQIIGTDTFSSIDAIKASQGLMEGAIYSEMQVNKDFQRRYAARFGNDNNISVAADMYEFALFAGELFGQTPHGASPDEVMQRLRRSEPRPGSVTGGFRYQSDPRQGQFFRFAVGLRRVRGLDWESLP